MLMLTYGRQLIPSNATAMLGRYESNPYNLNVNPSMRSSALTDLGAQRTLMGGTSGLTPSGDGSLPPGLALPCLQAFQPALSSVGATQSRPQLGRNDLPLSTLAPSAASAATSVGGVIVGHLLPPVPTKLVWKIWRGEYIDLNLLLPHRLGAPEPTLADAL